MKGEERRVGNANHDSARDRQLPIISSPFLMYKTVGKNILGQYVKLPHLFRLRFSVFSEIE